MKKDYSLTTIIMCLVFCACIIGINAMYLKRCIPLYSAGIAVATTMIITNIVCFVLRLKKQNRTARFDKTLMLISMLCAVIALSIPVIGTIVLMFK